MTDVIATWRERREWLSENEIATELHDTAKELYVIGHILRDVKRLDEATAGGVICLLNTIATKLTDIASGRLPDEVLPA